MKNLLALLIGFVFLTTAAAHPSGVVEQVVHGSAAEAAGLRVGDRIVRIADRALATGEDLKRIVESHRPGQTVPLVVERNGKTLTLQLTFGARPDGGAMIGVGLALAEASAADDPESGTAQCLAWIERTYQVESALTSLRLDRATEYDELRRCVARDTRRMPTASAVRYCRNVFQVHCSSGDLLAEIGETWIARCGQTLGSESGTDVRQTDAWRDCVEPKLFDGYVREGKLPTDRECRAALATCTSGTAGGSPASRRAPSPGATTDPDDPPAAWLHWGGPEGDFHAPADEIATRWPEDGPEILWDRELGPGYAAILHEDDRLYTTYRDGEDEVAVCLSATDGAIVWERRWGSPRDVGQPQFGVGPRATPAIAGRQVFVVGVAGRLLALDKADGSELWSRELWGEDLGGTELEHGYSSSPTVYGDVVIVAVGGERAGLVAFERGTGRERWRSVPFRNSYASPRILHLAGEDQVVVFTAEDLVGVEPTRGALRWRVKHGNQWRHNISPPIAVGGDTLFLSSPDAGARGVRLVREGDAVVVEQLWAARRVQFYHVTAVRIGDWVYGSSGTGSPAFMTAVNIRTGEIAWRERGFAKANCVEADGKLVLLDEDGTLALARATPERLEVLARTQLLDGVAWTVPTIVGRTLYVRDRARILAVDLGPRGLDGRAPDA